MPRPAKKPARPFENYQRNHRLEHEGQVWLIDAKAFYRHDKVVLRVYRIHGNVVTPLLPEALDQMAVSLGCSQNMSVRLEASL